jgi:hypothetical protein
MFKASQSQQTQHHKQQQKFLHNKYKRFQLPISHREILCPRKTKYEFSIADCWFIKKKFNDYFDMTHDNSPAKCMNKCSENNFKYAGVQYNYQCWCGKTFGNFGRAHNCYMTCPNNTVDLCGGAWSNDIYEIIPDKKSEPILMKSPVSSLILNTTVTSICENQQFEFNCPNGYVISVSYAMFGRISITKCHKIRGLIINN